MIKSMTGYGKSVRQLEHKSIQVEIRSLNAKGLDLSFRMPHAYKEKEPHFRNMVSRKLERGKIDVFATYDVTEQYTEYALNKSLFKKYYLELKDITDELKVEESQNLIPTILNLPDVLTSKKEEIDQKEWDALEECFVEALESTDNYRRSEGMDMEIDLQTRIKNISRLLEQIEPFEKQRIVYIKQKIQNNLLEFDADYDTNRFEQELIYYMEKLDINEEKVRLAKHISHFQETLNLENFNKGKKLGFIVQEMGREINTLGAKAYDSDIQNIVIQMKDELEKIKEQLSNIL